MQGFFYTITNLANTST